MSSHKHIAIIMDGNGRWAKAKLKPRAFGHEAGAKTVQKITMYCSKRKDVKRLTLYAFSTENWKRPKLEVEFLMKLLDRYLKKELQIYIDNNIKFEAIGDIGAFSKSLQNTITELESKTVHCKGLVQSLALNYGSKDEILRGINSLKCNKDISEKMINEALDCKMNVDVLIRTGGDHRLSNFLLWQSAYAELFFTDTLWPDFKEDEFAKIIDKFENIERKFGGLND